MSPCPCKYPPLSQLSPLEANEEGVCGSNQFKNAAQWLEEGGLEDSSDRVMHCWQEPGDIIYVPVSTLCYPWLNSKFSLTLPMLSTGGVVPRGDQPRR